MMIQSIKVTILGKQIPLKVRESEVENTRRIAAYVDEKLRMFRNKHTSQPDSTIMILTCLSIAEELFELRAELSKTEDKESEILEEVNREIAKLVKEIS